MNRNPVPIVLPCHRVVGANGSLTGYGGGLERKELLLKLEGAIQLELGESVASDKRAARDS
jgi:alkylated DNA nucleotide flippase Atl1